MHAGDEWPAKQLAGRKGGLVGGKQRMNAALPKERARVSALGVAARKPPAPSDTGGVKFTKAGRYAGLMEQVALSRVAAAMLADVFPPVEPEANVVAHMHSPGVHAQHGKSSGLTRAKYVPSPAWSW